MSDVTLDFSSPVCIGQRKTLGFTLIELIAVIVILGIVSSVGSNFIVSTVRSYDTVQARSKLVNRARVAVEQMTRQIRSALPNSARVSASGNCVEFMPLVIGLNYLSPVPDALNMAPPSNSISTAPYSLANGNPAHVSIAALDASEIYSAGFPGARVAIGALGTGPSYTSVALANSHRFYRNSVTQRIFIAEDPIRFCLVGTSLVEYSDYGFSTASLGDGSPGGSTVLMAEDVGTSGRAFALSQGTEDLNTAVDIFLAFSSGGAQIELEHQVLIRNVP